MKKIFSTLLLFFGAFAMTSCAVDDTTDVTPSTGEKTLTITTQLPQTRLGYNFDHTLEWMTGDSYAIFAVSESGENLAYIPAPEKAFNQSSYQITVPEGTASLYCLYPDSGEYDEFTDLSSIPFKIANTGYFGEGENFVMAAKAAVSGNSVNVVFKPLVSIAEFKFYDTRSTDEDVVNDFSLTGFSGSNAKAAGAMTVDFTSAEVALNSTSTSDGYVNLNSSNHWDGVMIGEDKESAGTVLVFLAKGRYTNLYLSLGRQKGTNKTFTISELDLTKDGCTININFSYDAVDVESSYIRVYAAVREGDGWKAGNEDGYEFQSEPTESIECYYNAETGKNETVFKVESNIYWVLNDRPLFTKWGAKLEKASDSQIVKIETDAFDESKTMYFLDANGKDYDKLFPLFVNSPALPEGAINRHFVFEEPFNKSKNYEYDGMTESFDSSRVKDLTNTATIYTASDGDITTRIFTLTRNSEAEDLSFIGEANWITVSKNDSDSDYERNNYYNWNLTASVSENTTKEARYGAIVVVSPKLSETYKTAIDFIDNAAEAAQDTENVFVFYVSQDGNTESGTDAPVVDFDFALPIQSSYVDPAGTIEKLTSGEYFDNYSQYGPVYYLTYPKAPTQSYLKNFCTFKGCPIQSDGTRFVEVSTLYGSEWLESGKYRTFNQDGGYDDCIELPINFDPASITNNPGVYQFMNNSMSIAFTVVIEFAYAVPEESTGFNVKLSLVSYTDSSITIKATPSDNETQYAFTSLSNSSMSNYGSPQNYYESNPSQTVNTEDIFTGPQERTFQSYANYGYDKSGFFAAQVTESNTVVLSTLVEYVHTWGEEPTLGGGR